MKRAKEIIDELAKLYPEILLLQKSKKEIQDKKSEIAQILNRLNDEIKLVEYKETNLSEKMDNLAEELREELNAHGIYFAP